MGITKLEGFDEKVVSMAAALKAIGHPARLSIMHYLSEKDQCICGDIVLELPLAQPTVSRHLAELKAVGLIKGSISGNNICYCIDAENWNQLQEYLGQISGSLASKNTCC
jgi:DNA-binding transcriptional ArsR family regulator